MPYSSTTIHLDSALLQRLNAYCTQHAQTPEQTITQLLIAMLSGSNGRSFDAQICHELTLSDLDITQLDAVFSAVLEQGQLPKDLSPKADPMLKLKALGLTAGDKLTYAAAILFAKDDCPLLPQSVMHVSSFAGCDKSVLLKNLHVRGNLYTQLAVAMEFCRAALKTDETGFERNQYALPPAAVHELLLNALTYRDYADPAGSVCVNIFDDRLQVSNRGSWPLNWNAETFNEIHPSMPCNPLISAVLCRQGLISGLGRGIAWVNQHCRSAKLRPVELSCTHGWCNAVLHYPCRLRSASASVAEETTKQVIALMNRIYKAD